MVHTTSAVALAVVALGAASTLAFPMIPAEDVLEMRSEIVERSVYPDFANVKRAEPVQPISTKDTAAGAKGAATNAKDHKAGAQIPQHGAQSLKGIKAGSKSADTVKDNGALPTRTVRVRPRATPCKPGQTPSVDRQRGGHRRGSSRSSRVGGTHHSGEHDSLGRNKGSASALKSGAHKADIGLKSDVSAKKGVVGQVQDPSEPQAVVARAVAVPTSGPTGAAEATPSKGGAAQTAAPTAFPTGTYGHGSHARGAAVAGRVYSTTTRMGRDKHRTVYHLVRATTARCYASQPTQHLKSSGHSAHKGDTNVSPAPLAGAGEKTAATKTIGKDGEAKQALLGSNSKPTKTTSDPKLVARAADIIERYYNELDELD